MLRLARTGWRVASLAALICAVWVPIQRHASSASASVPSRPTFDSTVLVAALPSVLSPPAVQPGSRLVSMVAEDIDADGDLDVVANDGSLDLIVWTNDGSGRLSRQQGRDGPGLRSEPAAPGLADQPAVFDTIVPLPFASLDGTPRILAVTPDQSPLWSDRSAGALLPALVSTRTPRGPPVSRLLT